MPLFVPARKGRVYFPRGTFGTLLTAVSTLYFVPVLFEAGPAFIDRIGITTTTAATGASTCRLGIYADRGGLPGQLLVDSGDISGMEATAGAKYADLTNIPYAFNQSCVWLAAAFSSAATTQCTVAALTAGAQMNSAEYGVVDFTALPSTAATTPNGVTATFTYAALPADTSTLTLAVVLNSAMPVVGVRALA